MNALPDTRDAYNPQLIRKLVVTVKSRYNYALNEDDVDDITMEAWKRIHHPKVTYEEGKFTNFGSWAYTRVRSAVDTYFQTKKVNVMRTFNSCVEHQLGVSRTKLVLLRNNEGDAEKTGKLLRELYEKSISTTTDIDMVVFNQRLANCNERTITAVQAVINGEYKCLTGAIIGISGVSKATAFRVKQTIREDLIRHGISEGFFHV